MRLYDVLNKTLNPMMRGFLRSPLHGLASGTLGILRYHGRKSGRLYEVPLSYVRDDRRVRFLSSHNTRWWFNFRDADMPVEVELARETWKGKAKLYAEDSESLRNGIREFLTALPRDAGIYGIGLDAQRKPREADIESAADGHVVLVEVTLD